MSARFSGVRTRRLAAALLVWGLVAVTQRGGCAARYPRRPTFSELGCRGNFEQYYLDQLERVCWDCYQLYSERSMYRKCWHNCYKNEDFEDCVALLRLSSKMPQFRNIIDYLHG
ncbi:crustacean hyperglycemic hormone-like [Amblyomma americanum]